MAVTHPVATRNGIADYVVDQLDGGVLRYLTAADATIADGSFGTPAFGAAAAGVATANAIGDATNGTGGTLVVAKAALRSTTADVVLCSVTTTGSGGDIEITDTSIADGVPITTSSLTYAAAP